MQVMPKPARGGRYELDQALDWKSSRGVDVSGERSVGWLCRSASVARGCMMCG